MDGHTAVGDAAIVQAVFDETIALLVFGNGGSAADAQHMTAEMCRTHPPRGSRKCIAR
jgi:phosphoheptose isomerase